LKSRASIGILFLIVFTDLLGFGIVIPLMPRYGEIYGASPAALGLLLASYSLLQFVFSPIWGRLSDRLGRKPILMLSLVGSVVGYAMFAAARSIPMLILARSIAGIMAANIATAQAYIADVTPPEKRAKGMGIVGAAFGLGFSLGPFFGGLLVSARELAAVKWMGEALPGARHLIENVQGLPALFAAFLSMAALVLTIVFLRESLEPGAAAVRPRAARLRLIWQGLHRPRVGIVYALFFIYTFGFTQMEVTLAQLIGDRYGLDITHSYWLFAWIGVLAALVQGVLIGPLTFRFGERALASAGILIVTATIASISFVPAVGWLMGVLALLAFGAGISVPSLSSLVSRLTPASEQGSALGIFQSISAIARIVGPMVAQVLYQNGAHVHAPYLLATGAGLVGFGLSTRLLRGPALPVEGPPPTPQSPPQGDGSGPSPGPGGAEGPERSGTGTALGESVPVGGE
jgi:DHA1 family tetracycline resistance protein-like MFS transporter